MLSARVEGEFMGVVHKRLMVGWYEVRSCSCV